jgi:glycerol-3-phosphate dehydrogenase
MKRDFSLLQGQQFDVLICGGGIYGAWTAYDAALRGLKVAIVEQGDWASATSSASSKLIHGGLRYLESYDFKLVKKALAERQLLLKIAPHRVWPLRFGVPVYADSRISRLQLKLGLMLYDFLAASRDKKMRHRYFGRQAFPTHFPLLDNTTLKGGFTYSDAQTDDARLVLELISGAMSAGAVCVNYCKLEEVAERQAQFYTSKVSDQLDGTRAEIHARQIVYATGQWSAAAKESRAWCRVTKGVHLILPGSFKEEALLLTAKRDGRVFFIIPWYGLTLIGTTDTDYTGDMQQVKVEEEEVAYLLEAANYYLKIGWTHADVINSYAGLRVMKRSDKSSPSAVSRDWELKTASNGVHYSIGGKITSAREDAASIVDRVCAELGVDVPCASNERLLPWAPQQDYIEWTAAIKVEAAKLKIDSESATWLMRRYGNRIAEVFAEIARDFALAQRITPAVPLIYADLLCSARYEMVTHLEDLLRRRMPLFLLNKFSFSELRQVAAYVAPILGWSADKVEREVAACAHYCQS